MNYQPTNGHAEALTEPNSTSAVVFPVIKKTKKILLKMKIIKKNLQKNILKQ